MSRKRGPGWRELMVETERDRHQPGLQPEELWCWVQGGDGTNFQTTGVLPPFSSSSHFLYRKEGEKKEKKRRERWRRVGGGEERTKWKPDTQPCLVWMWAVGRMMSQIWSGIFSSPFDTFYHFSIFLCRALFLYFSRLEILFDKQFEEKQRTFSTVSARYIEMTYCGLSNKHPLIFHREDGSSMMISYLWRLINTLHCLLVRSLKKFDTHRCSTEECGLAGVEKSACCQEKALT